MNPPVETVRISSRSREVLIKIKRRLGIERWNEICRVALCRSLANPTKPSKPKGGWDSAIEIEWKTFAGEQSEYFTALTIIRAENDKVDSEMKELLSDYFRAHIERGIQSLQNVKNFEDYVNLEETAN
jgi:DNA sulfur modification protein DndE